jgi:hypothetical protein
MGFLSGIVSAVVKTALTPVSIVKDAVDVATGQEPENTKSLLESASDDVSDATDDLGDGNIL